MKHTIRHKIGLNPAKEFGGALGAAPAGSGAEPRSGVKSTRKLYSSKSFVTDKKNTWSKVQSTD